jgi:hypothetical protein
MQQVSKIRPKFLWKVAFTSCFLLLCIFSILNPVEAQKKQPCLFYGTIDDVKIKSLYFLIFYSIKNCEHTFFPSRDIEIIWGRMITY